MDRAAAEPAVASLARVSSLVTAPESAAPGDSRATQASRDHTRRVSPDSLFALGLGAGLLVVVFIATGGTDLGPNTWTQIALLAIGVALAGLVLLKGASAPAWGGVTLALFAAVTVLTALSIAWSVQPDNSWLEADRTLSYLAAFGGAIALARLFPERWRGVIGAIAVLATVASGYALLVKVFPGTFDPNQALGRLVAPLDYWNATGLLAALGLPALLWGGSRTDPRRVVSRGLSVPAFALCLTVVVLSYSRSAVFAAIVAVGCWFAFGPLRLRGAAIFALGLAGAAMLTGWALLTHPLTHDRVALSSRTTAGHRFGVVILLTVIILFAAGLATAFAADRSKLAATTRRRIGAWLLVLVLIIPAGAITALLASSSRGVTGEISHLWTTATSLKTTAGDNAARLAQLDSTRSRDWSEGVKIAEHALLKGVGALGYGTARTRYRDPYPLQHTHSYVIQTFADFGLIGIAVNLALLLAWSVAAARPLRPSRARASEGASAPEVSAEHAGLLTLLCVVLAFGIHSTIDWTWFIPGVALPALFCAGWLAGRGPLASPVGRRAHARSLTKNPGRGAAIAGLAAVGLLAAWTVWQPLHSADAASAAVNAATRGDLRSALEDTRTAISRDPLALTPRFELSEIYSAAGDEPAARAALIDATNVQPHNFQTWLQLAGYDLQHGHPRLALSELTETLSLNVNSVVAGKEVSQANAMIAAQEARSATRKN
jgi:hypothetical protein